MISAKYANSERSKIILTRHSVQTEVPASLDNAVYRKIISDGVAISDYDGPSGDMAELKSDYRARVDADAERARLRYITPGSGMALTYQEKFVQAQAVAEMGATAANAMTLEDREAQFPTLSASVGIEAGTLYECAQIVLEKYAIFARASFAIESSRLSGKAAISAAHDAAGVLAAYEAVTWPTP